MYKIKLDDACTEFSLYDDEGFIESQPLVGTILQGLAAHYKIDVSGCISESHMLAVIQEHIAIEVVDE